MSLFKFLPTQFWNPWAWIRWGSYVHWRLETYGVYYPTGRFNAKSFISLLKQMPGYLHWVSDIAAARKKSPTPR
jgi:hypothetical protein